MPEVYDYTGRDPSGQRVTGTLVGDSPALVTARLREMGYVPLKVSAQNRGMKREINIRNRVPLKELAIFSRELATMVSSGVPILKSLAILERQTESRLLGTTIADIRVEIERGASLSAALSKHPKVFGNLYVSMVKAGETGGVLENVLDRIAQNLERELSLRQRIRSAMTYPIVVLGFVLLIMLAMLLFVVPQFRSIYGQLGGQLPLPTRILLAVSDAFKSKFLIFVAVVALIVFLVRRYKKTEQGRELWDRLKLRIPVFGPLIAKTALARFARVLSVLNKSGVPILQSLDVVAETVNNSLMSRAVLDVQQSVKEGESLAKPLARHTIFPPMVVQMLAVGEETGALDTMLEKVAIFYDDEVTATVDSLTAIIEPMMIFFVGGAVGLSVIALYMPMFNIIKLIK
ncbi:MAG: type II secretion system F family protein [Actinomycetota bacterium]|nr:type II secretion system F family protein [Actinomycetota bacterium]